MISQTAEYALRAISYLAQHFGQPCTSQQIAEYTHVPQDYMSKVLKGLVNAGMVTSQRGLYGGFQLALDPNDLAVIDVIDSVSPFKRITECPMGQEHGSKKLCPLHQMLDDAIVQIQSTFGQKTIGELLEEDWRGTAICPPQDEPTTTKAKSARGKAAGSKDAAPDKKANSRKRDDKK